MSKRLSQFPFYLWLIGSYPIWYLYVENMPRIDLPSVFLVWLVSMGMISAAFFGLRYLLRDEIKALVIVGVAALGFFSYGHVYNVLADAANRPLPQLPLSVVFCVLLVGLMALGWRYRAAVQRMTYSLNLVGLVLVIFQVFNAANYHVRHVEAVEHEVTSSITPTRNAENLPDIYYILMDTYGRDDWHLDQFDFDNSAFTDALRERGFYIGERSCTNYTTTTTSISSSLAMNYFNTAGLENFNQAWGEGYLLSYALINNQAAQIAQSLGYTYIHFSSGFLVTNRNQDADRVIDFGPDGAFTTSRDYRTSFLDVLLPTTLLRPVYNRVPVTVYRRYDAERVRAQFAELRTIPAIEEPTFTLAHFLKPHFPFIFDREGNPVPKPAGWIPEDDLEIPNRYDLYLDQLIYINNELLAVVDAILKESETPPIIIIQGDHNWGNDNDYGFPILNAYLVPEETRQALYPSISPINSFRLLYDTYWGLELGLLEDLHYYHFTKDRPFEMRPANEEELAWCR